MEWHTNWDPLEMVACVSPEKAIGLAGLGVSKTHFLFIFELGEDSKEVLSINKKYLAYWEPAAIESIGATEPWFWNIRFQKLASLAYSSKRLWWTTFETFPEPYESFPEGIHPTEVYVMDNGY